ncbi:MAG: hypothetical protein HUJ75_08885, partial [Parasporobacterium sp.]|nr:hypothetical protein [Parasporobacterium sp.]
MIVFALSVLGVFIAIKCGAEDLWKMDHDIQTVAQEPADDDTLADTVSKNYINGIYGFKNYMNAYTNELLLGRTTLAEAGAGYKKVIGFKVYAPGEYDSILYLDNGYLASANGSENPEDIGAIATKIKKLKETSEAAGAQFVYFQTPGNIDKFGDKDINNKLDFANANADMLIADLKSYGIEVLDYRDVIRERELASSQMITAEEKYENYHSIFYKTDHHWRIESAFEATRWLEGQLTDRYSIALNKEILSEENFTSEEYPAQYLGSLGKKATLATCDPDDFVILRPAFT